MAAFTNTFSWSASRDRLFRTCPRAYYYNYYAYWNGWSYNADEETKTIYKLKKLQGLPLWAGSTVHDVIQCFLELQQSISGIPQALDKVNPSSFLNKFQITYDQETAGYKKAEDLEEVAKEKVAIAEAIGFVGDELMLQRNALLLKAMARVKLRQGFKASLGQSKKFNNKALYLFEHYYDEKVGGEKFGEVADKIYTALENFCSSKDITNMLLNPPDQWRSVDELTKYNLTNLLDQPEDQNTYFYKDIPIWCAIDFAYTDFKGDLWIVDWKTGKENSEELKIQLASYAIFAQQEWQIPLDKIHLCGVFLNSGGTLKEYKLTPDEIENARQTMAVSARKMLIELDNQADNETSQSHYPCDPDDFKCRFCNFKGICTKQPILDKKELKPDSNSAKTVAFEPKTSVTPPELEIKPVVEAVKPVEKSPLIEAEIEPVTVAKESEPTPAFDFFAQSNPPKPEAVLEKTVAFEPKISVPPPVIVAPSVKPKKKTRYRLKIEENKGLKADLVKAKKEIRSLSAVAKRKDKIADKANDKVKNAKDQTRLTKRQVKTLQNQVLKQDGQIVNLTSSQLKTNERHKLKVASLRQEKTGLNREIRQGTNLVKKNTEKIERLQQQLDRAKSENSELQKSLKKKYKEIVYQPSLFEQDFSNYGPSKK